MSTPGETALTLGWGVVILLVLLAFIWAWRKTKGGVVDPRTSDQDVTSSTPSAYPYIRGSDLYQRSLAHRKDNSTGASGHGVAATAQRGDVARPTWLMLSPSCRCGSL